MPFKPNIIQRPSIGSTDGLFTPELFFVPLQHADAPSPELFDQELAELDLDLPFESFDELFSTFRDFSPVTPTPLTDSTICVYGASHYSSSLARTDYLISSDIETEGYGYCSLNNGLNGTHDSSIHSAIFSDGPPSTPSLHPTEAQFNFGTSAIGPDFLEIPPEDLSTAMQPPTGTPLPVRITPDPEVQMTSAPDRPFKCPHCSHSCKRMHNLKTHVGTHNKPKPFKCSICGRRFSYRHDLHRHCRIHRKQIPVSSISRSRSDRATNSATEN